MESTNCGIESTIFGTNMPWCLCFGLAPMYPSELSLDNDDVDAGAADDDGADHDGADDDCADDDGADDDGADDDGAVDDGAVHDDAVDDGVGAVESGDDCVIAHAESL